LTNSRGDVVLLHGLGRSPWSFLYAERRLRQAGFTPVNIAYPSRKAPLDVLARHVAERLPADRNRPVHFLTHSLGGIVLRCVAQAHRPPHLGRAVMLGPPNQGSQLASGVRGLRIASAILGPVVPQLDRLPGSVPNQLGPVNFEVGVIAGRSRFDPLHVFLAGESDGRVSLDETKVEGMADWIAVNRGHALLMFDPDVIGQAIHFFEHGRFSRTRRLRR
jgi:pimeloyl-ACP methyl ester carboxylesterase